MRAGMGGDWSSAGICGEHTQGATEGLASSEQISTFLFDICLVFSKLVSNDMSRHLPIDPGMTCLNTAKCRNVTHEIQVPVPWTLHLVKPRLQSGHFPILF